MSLTLFLFLTLLTLSTPASAINYYVATWGNDSNPGTLNEPWQHPSKMCSALKSGDTLWFMNGTWNYEHIHFISLGTNDKPIRLMKYNGTVTLDGIDKTIVGIQTQNANGLKVDGLNLKNYIYAVYFTSNASNVEISNVSISDTSSRGIYFSGTGNSVASNISIHDITISRMGNAAISHEYGFVNSHDFDIFNFSITDANDNGQGIRLSSLKSAHIHNGHIQNMSDGCDALLLGSNTSDSLIENMTINKTGWHGIGLHSNGNIPLNNITIRNCTVSYPSHGAIDVHTGNKNILIENVILFGDPEGQGGVNTLYNSSDLTIRNSEVYGFKRGIQFYEPNGSVWNCTVHNVTEYPLVIADSNISINNCNFSKDPSVASPTNILVYENGDNYTINNTQIDEGKEIKILNGSGTLKNMVNSIYKINAKSANVTVEYTNGKVFSATGSPDLSKPSWAPNRSYVIYNAGEIGRIVSVTTYNMYVKPSFKPVTVAVNTFNTSLPPGNVLVNFTVDSPVNNKVSFCIGGLKPGHCYIVNRDRGDIELFLLKADCSGNIKFNISNWCHSEFNIKERE